jgi:small conductance mechanosensitive channel
LPRVRAASPHPAFRRFEVELESASSLLEQKLAYLYKGFVLLLPNIGIGVVVLVVFLGGAWLAQRTIVKVFERRRQFDLGALLGGFIGWGLIGLGCLVVATIIFPSVKPSDALATLGIGSVAIGFAFKDILQNWFAGLLILLRQPFVRGDQISVAGFEGTVEHIEARATAIKTYDGKRVVIPNSTIYTLPVTVGTAFKQVRSVYDVGIGYADDIEAARSVILGALDGLEGVMQEPKPEVIPWEIGPSSVNLRVRWWTDSKRSAVTLARGRVISAMKTALADAQIDMPYATQVVLFHNQTEETDGDRAQQREGWPAGNSPPASRAQVVDGRIRRAARPATLRSDEVSSEGEL